MPAFHQERNQVLVECVQREASKLRAEAEKSGLRAADVDRCILAALETTRTGQTQYCILNWLRTLLKILALVAFVIILAYILISSHKPTKQYIKRLGFNTSYQVLRGVRLLSLPILRRVDLSRFYHASCLIPNPWFRAGVPWDCIPCQFIKFVPLVTNPDIHGFDSPFQFEDPNIHQFTFDEMKKWYFMNQKTFTSVREDHVWSSNPYIQTISDLFTMDRREEDIGQASFSLEWRAASAGSVRLVRNLCGKPSFIQPASEVQPEMTVIVESPSSHAHYLPRLAHFGKTWLSQAHGSREITLTPIASCKSNCTDVSLILGPGRVVFFNSLYWHLMSFPFDANTSISCLGSFY